MFDLTSDRKSVHPVLGLELLGSVILHLLGLSDSSVNLTNIFLQSLFVGFVLGEKTSFWYEKQVAHYRRIERWS